MPLQYDPETSEIRYEGKVVGKYTVENGVARVRFDITYECLTEEWIVPLSWFAYGLAHLRRHRKEEPVVGLKIETAEEDIAEEYDALRLLTEKTVRQNGYVWRFHKNDPDPWPSELHAHDYDKNLKLDALTGEVYDAATRQRCKKLNHKALAGIQAQLRASHDFAQIAARLL
jgi:hypothetical protein